MGMVKASVQLIAGVALAAQALAANVVDTVFGVTERTPYCGLDSRANVYTVAFWLQDVVYTLAPNHKLILRYTTSDEKHPSFVDPRNTTGNMSVYEEFDGNVYVVAEYAIRSNFLGQPVWIDGIQEYVTKQPFSPVTIADLRVPYVSTSFGSYKYCPVDRNPFTGVPDGSRCSPWSIDNSWYRYVVAVTSNGTTITVAELYWQSFTTTDYARMFEYNVADTGHTLVRVHDFPTNTTYYRHRTVTDGVCSDRY